MGGAARGTVLVAAIGATVLATALVARPGPSADDGAPDGLALPTTPAGAVAESDRPDRPAAPPAPTSPLGAERSGVLDRPADARTPAERRLRRHLVIAASGDILPEGAVLAAGARFAAGTDTRYRFDPLLDPLDPWHRAADLAICHMETPIGAPGARPGVYGRSPFGGNLLLAPYEMARSLRRAGFDRCSTASNHSGDLGLDGIATTLAAFDDVGITHTGTARTPEEAVPTILDVNGIRVAHLSYTTSNNTVTPADPWRLAFTRSPERVIADVADVRRRGAEIVVLSIHVGRELDRQPLGVDRAFVDTILANAEVDLVVRHGPHVVQPVEKVRGTWVHWSVGNLLSGMGGGPRYGPDTLDGLMAWATFTERRTGGFRVEVRNVLLCTDPATRVMYPGLAALEDPTTPESVRVQIRRCIDRTRPVVPDLS